MELVTRVDFPLEEKMDQILNFNYMLYPCFLWFSLRLFVFSFFFLFYK